MTLGLRKPKGKEARWQMVKPRLCIAPLLIVGPLLVFLRWVEAGDEYVIEEPVEFVFEDPVKSDNCAGKMIIPSKSLLSLLC